jgi:hypothetical protein
MANDIKEINETRFTRFSYYKTYPNNDHKGYIRLHRFHLITIPVESF